MGLTEWRVVLLTIATTAQPASDLGFLLHKHPGRVQSFDVSVGVAHVFSPEVGKRRTTAALLLEVDPVGLVRVHGPSGEGFALGQYVNDRPYAASSMLAVAILGGIPDRAHRPLRQPPGAGRLGHPARAAHSRAAVPGRDRPGAAGLRAARLAGHGHRGAALTRPCRAGGSPVTWTSGWPASAAGRRAQPPVRAAAGA